MALYAFDGTWNTEKTKDSANNEHQCCAIQERVPGSKTALSQCYVAGIVNLTS